MTLEKFLSTLTEAKKQRLAELGYTPEEFVEEYNEHAHDYTTGNPAVYCGSWFKYNCGNLSGQWVDLTTFGGDYDDFIAYCNALHCDEPDPELHFQDYEGFPEVWYDEYISEAAFDNIMEYMELCDEYDSEVVDAYMSATGASGLSNFREAYFGQYDSESDFAEYMCDECYPECPDYLRNYIDIEAFGRDLMYDYTYEGATSSVTANSVHNQLGSLLRGGSCCVFARSTTLKAVFIVRQFISYKS